MTSIADFFDSIAGLDHNIARSHCVDRLLEDFKCLKPQFNKLRCFKGLKSELCRFEEDVLNLLESLKKKETLPNILPQIQSCRDCEVCLDLRAKLDGLCMLLMYAESKGYIAFAKLAGSSGTYCRGAAKVSSGNHRGKYVGAN